MSLQAELELRAHDLPPSWDGTPLTWRGWEPALEGAIFICPPPKIPSHCSRCGSVARPLRNVGLSDAPEVGHPVQHVIAYRCPDCRFDQAWDLVADAWWDLGPEDYGDGGSVPPADPRPSPGVPKRQPPSRADAIAAARAAVDEARAGKDGLF